MVFKPVPTPCVGICSTGIGDNVCRGCKRFAHEVIHWNAYSMDQRRIIANRLERFLTQVVEHKIHLFDDKLLLAQITHQQIEFKEEQGGYCWVYDLLRAGARQIDQPEMFGFSVRPEFSHYSLWELRKQIDHDYYALSTAYYDRYIAPGEVQTLSIETSPIE
ncbi:DUF1289 domain-containing protein [Marinibactrum halimedae]|uniref:DUF1289 domain-containing protein n=1 Tax=Marinibactrum halimedae TaxID=1444977 RepID=A0AA37TAE1_9GAMM|nr:DUF1289 domain-containing protein [Marinibactrum halimedae]